ncbi:MAG TPA: hypothetical protein VFE52_06690 [Devosia sp.]|jgi:hypothetical protein|nr:hypothetical protein [Devosia sp.]
MRRLFATITLLFALVSLSTPSLAIGSRAFTAEPAPLMLLQDDGTYIQAPCHLTGKRALNCRPDMGVLPSLALRTLPAAEPVVLPLEDAMPTWFGSPPPLPPPRRG